MQPPEFYLLAWMSINSDPFLSQHFLLDETYPVCLILGEETSYGGGTIDTFFKLEEKLLNSIQEMCVELEIVVD